EDSNSIVVFGGRTSLQPEVFTGSIYILDIATTSWKQGPPLATSRIYAACVVVGDQFVVWGGSPDANNTASGTPLVYDLTQNLWVNSYTAPAYYANTSHPGTGSGSGGGSEFSKRRPITALVGGIVGALLFVGVIAAIIFFYRRKISKRSRNEELEQMKMLNAAERPNEGGSKDITSTGSPPDYTTRDVFVPTLRNPEAIINNQYQGKGTNTGRNPQEYHEGMFSGYPSQVSSPRSKNPQLHSNNSIHVSSGQQQKSTDVKLAENSKH
ncbi:hypothetical protein BGZ49_003475, partial [Haplosporangium sp. Z 27]